MSWRVGGKLALGFGSVLAVVVTSALLSWRDGRRVLQHADHLYQEGVVVTEALGQAETQLHATRSAVYRHIATDDDPRHWQAQRIRSNARPSASTKRWSVPRLRCPQRIRDARN